MNTSYVFPKLLGPELVGVFFPIFFIRIFASAGISSTSSSLSLLKALATVSFGNAVWAGSRLNFNLIPDFKDGFRFTVNFAGKLLFAELPAFE